MAAVVAQQQRLERPSRYKSIFEKSIQIMVEIVGYHHKVALVPSNKIVFCFFRCEGSAKMYGLNILPYDSSFPGLPNRTGGEITKRTPLHIFLNLKLQDLSTAENT